MKTFNLIAISAIASSLLAGCGGSSNSGNNSSQPQPPVITKYDRAIPAPKDYYTYKVTIQNADGSNPKVLYRTDDYWFFNESGTQRHSVNISEPYLSKVNEFVKQDGSITSYYFNKNLSHKFSVNYDPDYDYICNYPQTTTSSASPYYVGQSWDNSAQGECYINGKTWGQARFFRKNKGSIVAQETVIVPAGGFTSLKEVFTNTYTQIDSNGKEVVLNTSSRTCWRDVKTSIYVKCQIMTADPYYEFILSNSTNNSSKLTVLEELIGFSVKNGNTLLVPQRFAGNWNVNFQGASTLFDKYTVNDRPMSIDPDGNISMALWFTHTSSNKADAVFQGKIDSSGNLKMTGSSYDGKTTYKLTGVADSTSSASGTIVSSTGVSQIWYMNRF